MSRPTDPAIANMRVHCDQPTETQPARPSRFSGRSGKEQLEEGRPVRWPELRPPEPADPDLPVPTPEMPNKGVRVGRRRRLLRVAADQMGLFTVAQAFDAGLDRRARYHHLTYGNWRRTEAPSVLRLSGWPPDPHERLRAWMLWAGPGAVLTSWTALGLAGLTAHGPRVPVGLEVPFGRDRAGRRRRQRLQRQLDDAAHSAGYRMAELHRSVPGTHRDHDGMPVRPPEEAICAAVNQSRSGGVAIDLAKALLEAGRFDERDLRYKSQLIGCGPLTDLLLRRLVG